MVFCLSIVIPTYNRLELLKQCLERISHQSTNDWCEWEVTVVLDKLDCQSEQWLDGYSKKNDKVKFVRALSPGANAARNKGIEQSRGQAICFLDDDCLLPIEGWIDLAHKAIQNYKEAAAVGGGYIINRTDNLYALSRNQLDNFYLERNMKDGLETTALLGGNSIYRRETFSKYGVFDEMIRYGGAETEMNDRILQDGGRLYFVKQLSVIHSTEKNSVFCYFNKSFRQGTGKAYSYFKHKSFKKDAACKRKRFWFFAVAKRIEGGLGVRTAAGLFLFCNSLSYWLGSVYGFLKQKLANE